MKVGQQVYWPATSNGPSGGEVVCWEYAEKVGAWFALIQTVDGRFEKKLASQLTSRPPSYVDGDYEGGSK